MKMTFEISMTKGVIADYDQFLLLLQCSQVYSIIILHLWRFSKIKSEISFKSSAADDFVYVRNDYSMLMRRLIGLELKLIT